MVTWFYHHDMIPPKAFKKNNNIKLSPSLNRHYTWILNKSSLYLCPIGTLLGPLLVQSPHHAVFFTPFLQPTSASPISGNAWRRPSPSFLASFWPSSLSSHSLSTTSTWSWRRASPSSPEIAPCTRTCSQQHHGGPPQLSPKLTWQKTCLLNVPGLTPQRKSAVQWTDSLMEKCL